MKKWILMASLLTQTNCFAGSMMQPCIHDGAFIGIGAGYNTINVTQNSWGEGISNIITSTGTNSNGIAVGTGAPFHPTTNTFSPEIQAGYFQHFPCSQNLYGVKFSYQYLNSTATNPNLYIPQVGTTTSTAGVTTPLFGYVNADSVQVSTNHEFLFLGFLGQSCGNKYFYLGVGPSFYRMGSRNYYSIGYANYDGATLNVTGLVSYSTPPVWLWGGAVQLGMTYFISPTLFIDASYTYSRTGSKTISYQQTFSNSATLGSVNYTTSGTLFTKDTLSLTNQSVKFTINKVFDI